MVLAASTKRVSNMKAKGFTLLEVMIAITIFALVASTLSQTTSVSVDNQLRLEERMIASWLAENQIIELRSLPWQDIKDSQKEVEMASQKWQLITKIKPQKKFGGIAIPLDIKRAEVSVHKNNGQNGSPIITLSAYLANETLE